MAAVRPSMGWVHGLGCVEFSGFIVRCDGFGRAVLIFNYSGSNYWGKKERKFII